MSEMVERDERGTIRLPRDLLAAVKPHTRFVLEGQGETIVLRPVAALPFWQTATPQERADAVRQWAALERPAVAPFEVVSGTGDTSPCDHRRHCTHRRTGKAQGHQ